MALLFPLNWTNIHTYHTYSESRHPKVTKNPYNSYSQEVSQNFASVHNLLRSIGTLTFDIKTFKTSKQNFKPPKTLKIWRLWELTLDSFLINIYLWWKFTSPSSWKYYVFLAFLDDDGQQYFIIDSQPRIFFISKGLNYILKRHLYDTKQIYIKTFPQLVFPALESMRIMTTQQVIPLERLCYKGV